MLSEYEGPANSPEMLQYLVGEQILAAFRDGHNLVLILGSDTALVLSSWGGQSFPTIWKENTPDAVDRINRRRREVDRKINELKGLKSK